MRVTEIHELNKVVVAYSGNAFWFDSMAEAEEFMRKIEDSLLFQQTIKKIKKSVDRLKKACYNKYIVKERQTRRGQKVKRYDKRKNIEETQKQ